MEPFNEDTGKGLLRHVLVRRGIKTGEIMVVLVLGTHVFPSGNNFVKELLKLHPEISTVVININEKRTSMVLGEREKVSFGKGYITDELCGCRFRISPSSFYQINPLQTEVLYNKAVEFAGLTGKERVIDAYCGIGTLGMVAANHAKNGSAPIDLSAAGIAAEQKDVIAAVSNQNFVPIVDGRGVFCGIITRKGVIESLAKELE